MSFPQGFKPILMAITISYFSFVVSASLNNACNFVLGSVVYFIPVHACFVMLMTAKL